MVIIPTTADIHIQNIAPGPPAMSAVATPVMLPVPSVAARAVQNAWNWDMDCSSSVRLTFLLRKSWPSVMPSQTRHFLNWKKPVRTVKRRPTARKMMSMPRPQIKSRRTSLTCLIYSIIVIDFSLSVHQLRIYDSCQRAYACGNDSRPYDCGRVDASILAPVCDDIDRYQL